MDFIVKNRMVKIKGSNPTKIIGIDPYLVVSKDPMNCFAKISRYQLLSVFNFVMAVNFSPWVCKSNSVGRVIIKLTIPAKKEVTTKSRKDDFRVLKSQEIWQRYQKIRNNAVIYPK